jgi:voltage-gated potassium channel
MKLVSTHLSYLLTQNETRQNLRALAKYVIFLLAVIAVYSVVFHWIMWEIEGREHSWITGVYWTLTVMSTLGFGDITFQSDLGRAFSVLVLLSGVVLLLIVLPFAFIRFFYAPGSKRRSACARRAPCRRAPAATSSSAATTRSSAACWRGSPRSAFPAR